MDELIRAQIHDALDVEPPRLGLRSRIIASVPMERPRTARRPAWSLQWAGGFVAGLLAAALIAALSLSYLAVHNPRGSATPQTPPLISPEGIAVAPDGQVYVSDYVGNRVFRIERNGMLTVVAGGGTGRDGGPATKASLFRPAAIVFDKSGNLFVGDSVGGTIRRINTHGIISTFALASAPLGLGFGSDGALYEAGYTGDLNVFASNGQRAALDVTAIPPPKPQFSYLTFDSGGILYVADRAPVPSGEFQNSNGGCRIIRAAPVRMSGTVNWAMSVVAGTGTCGYSGDGGPAAKAELGNPAGVAFDSAGNLYIADTDNHRIRRVAPDGTITTIAGTGVVGYGGDGGPAASAQLESPTGMAVAPGNLLYFSDAPIDPTSNGRVRMIDLSTGIITTVVR